MFRLTVFLLASLMVTVGVCQEKVSKAGLFTYTGPAGYKANAARTPAGRLAVFASPKNNYSSNVMFSMANAANYKSAKVLGDETVTYLKTSDKAVSNVSGKVIKLAGGEGFLVISDRKIPNGMVVGQRQVIGIHNGQAVIITFSALKADAKKLGSVFDATLPSFRWLN